MRRVALLLLALVLPAAALDTLRVGGGSGQTADWSDWVRSARFVSVAEDSVWTWRATPGDNLALDALARGGRIAARVIVLTNSGTTPAIRDRRGLDRWMDGDATTAWAPEDDVLLPGDAVAATRNTTFYLDLGATFRVDRIRFYPRLDAEHRGLILGRFEVMTASGDGDLEAGPYRSVPGLSFTTFSPNRQPVVDASFARRDVRYVRLRSAETEPWEIAEFEVLAEGTVPPGELLSEPLFVPGGFPIWGSVSWDGGALASLPVTVQTRTGPDDEPLLYYLQRGDELEQVTEEDYEDFNPLDHPGSAQVDLGPVLPNPSWSLWQSVADGQVLSPAPRRFLQFRLLFPDPGTRVQSLFFEYVGQPLADDLIAEVWPLTVDVATETAFTLSLEVQIDPGRGDTGFRYIDVRTPAAVRRVRQVRVDDEPVVFTPTVDTDGFSVDIWERIAQSGSFVQIDFDATVLRDGAAFEVRARDVRPADEEGGQETESVYQTARPGDVDVLTPGGELVVRLTESQGGLVQGLQAPSAFTPNGDGINDVFEISYHLLKMTRPVPVAFEVYDLAGRRLAHGVSAAQNGTFARLWSGRTDAGEEAAPGLYLYRVRVDADAGQESRTGVVHLVR